MVFTRTEAAKHIRDSLNTNAPMGKTTEIVENARAFYKYSFTNYPELRKYFKGVEHYTVDDIATSERFEKDGKSTVLAMWLLANTYEDQPTFRAYAREIVNRHRQYKMEPDLWAAFFSVYVGYLESRGGPVTDDQKAAWKQMGAEFNEECQIHLTALGLPHC